jgi:lactoylglutathione lyase
MADVSLTLVGLKTRQVEQLRRFYQTLGIDFAQEQHGQGPVHYAGQVGGLVIEIYPLRDDGNPVDASTRLGFAVDDVAQVLQRLQAIGTEIVTPPRETVWGLQAVVRDPDGRAVELSQRR